MLPAIFAKAFHDIGARVKLARDMKTPHPHRIGSYSSFVPKI